MRQLFGFLACAAAIATTAPALAQPWRPGPPSGPTVDQAALQASAPAMLCDGRVRVVVTGEVRSPNLVYSGTITFIGSGSIMVRVIASLPASATGNTATNSTVWRTLRPGETWRSVLFMIDPQAIRPSTTNFVAQHLTAGCR